MRIARFSIDGNVAFGAVEGEGPDGLVLDIIKGIPYGDFELSGTKVPLSKVRLLPPVLPNKVVAIGRNYAEHAKELGNEVPEVPVAFFKPTTSVIGPGDNIEYPSFSNELHHEAELAVVIGRMCREVPRERVKDVIFGYTCANDVTARDAQQREKQWARAKGFDTSSNAWRCSVLVQLHTTGGGCFELRAHCRDPEGNTDPAGDGDQPQLSQYSGQASTGVLRQRAGKILGETARCGHGPGQPTSHPVRLEDAALHVLEPVQGVDQRTGQHH